APRFIANSSELSDHYAFIEDTDPQKRFVVMSGSCEMLSVWPGRGIMREDASIPKQVELHIQRNGLPHVTVLNLATTGYAATRNLHMFLRFLEDSRYPMFVWQNDICTVDIKKNRILPDAYIHSRLYALSHTNKDIPEIQTLLHKLSRE